MPVKINKLTLILLWVLMGLTAIFAVIFFIGGVVPGTEGTRYEEPGSNQTLLSFFMHMYYWV